MKAVLHPFLFVVETDGPLLSQMLKVIRNIQNKSKNQKSSEIPEVSTTL